MKWLYPVLLGSVMLATPAHAERLEFDYRVYPPLKTVLDSGRSEMVQFDDSNPRYVTDRIAIQGSSAQQWTEALDIIVRLRAEKMRQPADWANEIQQRARAACPSTFTTLAEDANSLTFMRQSSGCAPGTPLTGLYRIVAGKRSLFMLSGLTMAEMSASLREQWLKLLATAHVKP